MSKSSSVFYKVPPDAGKCRGVVLAFHGGCFIGGNAGWDVAQNRLLAKMGYAVWQLAFPKTWTAWKVWAAKFDWTVLEARGVPVHCIGRSSGGYLARAFDRMHPGKISKLLLLCPVVNPALRAKLLPKFEAKTLGFFGTTEEVVVMPALWEQDEDDSREDRVMLMLAHQDRNVPDELFNTVELRRAVYPGPASHTGVLGCVSKVFAQTVYEFLVKS